MEIIILIMSILASLVGGDTLTLLSLRQVDDHPLYTMTYYGDYDLDACLTPPVGAQIPAASPGESAGTDSPACEGWACSLFAAFGSEGQPLYGRNFDWDWSPAVLLFTDPPGRYASVSIVDAYYLGFTRAEATESPSWEVRRNLLSAPYLPFDGMNEHGLVVGMAAVPGSRLPADPALPSAGILCAIRLMLDRARTTDEALALLRQINLALPDVSGEPPVHYLIADPSGHSAVVEFYEGEMRVFENDRPWQVATNFYLSNPESCWRYDLLTRELESAGGAVSPEGAMALLDRAAQDHTQWSVVYDMAGGAVRVALDGDTETAYTFHLPLGGE